MIVKFLPVFDHSTTDDHGDITFAHTLAVDACLQGVGDNNVYTNTLPHFIKTNAE